MVEKGEICASEFGVGYFDGVLIELSQVAGDGVAAGGEVDGGLADLAVRPVLGEEPVPL